jgi:post-segregation antitoxin (ccd killing protein)
MIDMPGKFEIKPIKATVSLCLSNLVERVQNQGLNFSRITEQALSSILDYVQPQNNSESSIKFLSEGSFPKESSAPIAQRLEQRFRKP